jgi:hypothetical protein
LSGKAAGTARLFRSGGSRMDKLSEIQQFMWVVVEAATAALAGRVLWARLAVRYRWLILFLVFLLGRNAALMTMSYSSNRYAYTWAVTLVVKWILSALVVREIAGMVLESYKGLSVLSRRTLAWLIVMCAAGALAVVSFGFDYSKEPFPLLRTVLLFEQGMAATLCLVLLLAASFVLWFPVPFGRNVHLYCAAFSLSLLVNAVAVGVRTWGGSEWTQFTSLTMMFVDTLCFGVFAWRFRREHEAGPLLAAIPRGAEAERRLLNQLAELNQALETGRKRRESNGG